MSNKEFIVIRNKKQVEIISKKIINQRYDFKFEETEYHDLKDMEIDDQNRLKLVDRFKKDYFYLLKEKEKEKIDKIKDFNNNSQKTNKDSKLRLKL